MRSQFLIVEIVLIVGRKLQNENDINKQEKPICSTDEVPGDLQSFFEHPLSTNRQENGNALLHEYQNFGKIKEEETPSVPFEG